MWAAVGGSVACMELALARGCDVNAVEKVRCRTTSTRRDRTHLLKRCREWDNATFLYLSICKHKEIPIRGKLCMVPCPYHAHTCT